ncbi:MAG: hypothetical protein JWM40_1297 [Frankiales bacterium]|nr:hypothetical protein [Frankiales bacterium]
MTRPYLKLLAVTAAAGVALSACSGGAAKPAVQDGQLVGLFRLTPGTAAGSAVSGTYFRMLTPGAGPKGPFMQNGNSKADGGRATTLSPGTSGGLRTAGYQSQPSPAFTKRGDSSSAAITRPTAFFGVLFGIATNQVDPQTKTDVAPPTVTLKGGKLTADLSSWAVTWNNQYFNQGAPKPVSSTGAKAPGQVKAEKVWDWVAGKYLDAAPAATVTGSAATGTFDTKTKHFVLEWTSLISGGPFNRFTGLWHLEGTFEPSGRAPS